MLLGNLLVNNLSSQLVLKANKTIYENPGYFFKLWFLPSSKTVGLFKLWLSLNIKYSMCRTGKLDFFLVIYLFLKEYYRTQQMAQVHVDFP